MSWAEVMCGLLKIWCVVGRRKKQPFDDVALHAKWEKERTIGPLEQKGTGQSLVLVGLLACHRPVVLVSNLGK